MESNSITGAAFAPAKEAPGQPKPAQPAQPKKSKAEQLEAEVLKLSKDLDKAETNSERIGRKFGEKLIELRDLRKREKTQDWMAYLDQVVKVSYEKARYWINVVEGKSNHRHYHEFGVAPNPSDSGGSGRSVFQRPLKNWKEAMKRLDDFMVPLKVLYKKGNKGSDMLVPALKELAAIAGCQLVEPPKTPKYPEPSLENFAALKTKSKPATDKTTKTKAELAADAKKAEEKAKQEATDKARQAENEAATDTTFAEKGWGVDEETGKPVYIGKQDADGEQVVQ
jgi:hypothetical protein